MKIKFGIILIKPQLGENIGACARSMKNFGINNLKIVSPKFSFPNHKTKVTSVGAFDIIKKAGIPQVGKSSCFFCPAMKKNEIKKLHSCNNDLFERAIKQLF